MQHSTRSKRRQSRATLLSLALLLAVPGAAGADTEAAKLHFSRAQINYKLNKFKAAIADYEAAYREMPSAAFLFNIAQSYRRQYDQDKDPANLRKALAGYKSYLRDSPDPPNRETVLKLISELKMLLSSVQGDPAYQRGKLAVVDKGSAIGGSVAVDGKQVGVVPLTTSVTPGEHFVKVSKQGFQPWSQTVSLTAGARVELSVTLLPQAQTSSTPSTPTPGAKPLYKRWWFWTIVGAVVTAGTGTAIYFASRDDGGDGLPQIDLRSR